jgi:hypothetical protein
MQFASAAVFDALLFVRLEGTAGAGAVGHSTDEERSVDGSEGRWT